MYIVGGGARNTLLCQLAADATGCKVVAGPTEATALGNVIIQAMGAGEIRGMDQAHDVARASAHVASYEPRPGGNWDELQGRLAEMRAKAQIAAVAGG